MRILVDGDACPVKKEIKKISLNYSINVIYYCSVSHFSFDNIFENIIYVDNLSQEVDIKILNEISPSDIVITGDYGLAAASLSRKAQVISFSGDYYTNDNIEQYLYRRYLFNEQRKNKIKVKNIQKRTKNDNIKFSNKLEKLIKMVEKDK